MNEIGLAAESNAFQSCISSHFSDYSLRFNLTCLTSFDRMSFFSQKNLNTKTQGTNYAAELGAHDAQQEEGKQSFILMRGNQLPVSDTRWQHGSQLCLATFSLLTALSMIV
jgi:hypothetical protein